MFNDLKQRYNKLDLIILNGDQIAHRFFKLDIGDKHKKQLYYDSFNFIYEILKTGYPEATILTVIGNNDFFEHYTTPEGESKKEQISFFNSLYFTSGNMDIANLNFDFEETISDSMYYSYKLGGTKFIILNSINYSTLNIKFNITDCDRQLKWLERELSGPGKKFITMHLPPFPFYWINKTDFYYLHEEYIERFDDLVYRYRDSIINVFASHLHWMKFGILIRNETRSADIEIERLDKVRTKKIIDKSQDSKKYFNIIHFASVSPIYYNNPIYSVLKYDKDKQILNNIITYSADLNRTLLYHQPLQWNSRYDSKKDLGFIDFNNENMYDLVYHHLEQPRYRLIIPYYLGGYPRYGNYKERLLIRGMILRLQ
jgi:hypothetical protein